MSNPHPDIRLGEPIPKVEPRIDPDMLQAVRMTSFMLRGVVGLIVVVGIVSRIMHLDIFTALGFYVGFMVLFGIIMVIWRIKKYKSKPKEKRIWNPARRQDLKWSVPFRYSLETTLISVSIGVLPNLFITQLDARFTIGMLGMLGVFVGVTLSIYSRIARQPGQICCEECEYPLLGLTLPCLCPECGYSLLMPSYTTDRPHVRSPWLTWGGPAAIALGLAIALTGFLRPGVFYAPIPRSVLFGIAVNDTQAFKRLTNTQISPEETARMIDLLIDKQMGPDGWPYNAYEQGDWLMNQHAKGSMSDEQLDRIMDHLHPIRIEHTKTPRVGEPITFTLATERIRMPGTGFGPHYFFGGFTVDDEPAIHGQSERLLFPMYLYTDKSWQNIDGKDADSAPQFTLTPTEPGTITVHARVCWIVLKPKTRVKTPYLTWAEDGQPNILTPVIWSRINDIETTITVQP